ncbi:phosphate propanoyltransferase [Lysinibacillus sphaericus]|uniref:Phosphate propanoyltransferase n=1 Tax=Lysinibacillus sphaericus TaxID=1421 RepID=A0A2S0K225_LYSSH|nr:MULTISPECIES: phosphate propanoyltransferase [Lysinibacillus]AVK97435.1 propanediol utilization protein [Lysinibacillus sphaericus]MCS1382368.1 phosphate propanoyltransferase [Lysinibacillus sphaericus]MED4542747.1 phosphate propanoyltransferase [Lysinibacillus sphaericus]
MANLNIKSQAFPVAISARHIHVSEKDLQALFGPNATLTKDFDLSQPGQFAAKERVSIEGPKGVIHNVRVLGPVRAATQVEISRTDAMKLGLNPPLRQSGDIENSASIKLIYQQREVLIEQGVIIAQAHIHMTEEDAKALEVHNNEIVSVEVDSERPVTFRAVVVRVSNDFSLEMHIDTDEANAGFIAQQAQGRIVKSCS